MTCYSNHLLSSASSESSWRSFGRVGPHRAHIRIYGRPCPWCTLDSAAASGLWKRKGGKRFAVFLNHVPDVVSNQTRYYYWWHFRLVQTAPCSWEGVCGQGVMEAIQLRSTHFSAISRWLWFSQWKNIGKTSTIVMVTTKREQNPKQNELITSWLVYSIRRAVVSQDDGPPTNHRKAVSH